MRKKGGYANNTKSMYGLAAKAEAEGVRIITGVDVKGFNRANGSTSAVRSVITDRGNIACDYVIAGVGPWVRDIWNMLELPKRISVKGTDGMVHENVKYVDLLAARGRGPECRSRIVSYK